MFNVILENGSLCLEEVDFELPGFIPVEFGRQYQSTRLKNGRLGYGWSWPWEIKLRLAEGRYFFDVSDGVLEEQFEVGKQQNGEIISESGSKLIIGQNGIAIRRSDDYVYNFPLLLEEGYYVTISSISNVYGQSLRFNYKNLQLEELIDADRRRFKFSYDNLGRIYQIYLVQGGTQSNPPLLVTYEYNPAGDLVRVIDRCRGGITYQYVDHLLVAVTNRAGGQFFAQYDNKRRCVKNWRADGYLLETFYFDDTRKQMAMIDPVGYRTIFSLNEKGLITTEKEPNGNCVQSIYDLSGGLIATVDDSNSSTSLSIEIIGNKQKTIIVDASNNLVEQAIDLKTGVKTIKNAKGDEWIEEYDNKGKLIQEKSPLGASDSYVYDSQGILVSKVEPNGNRIRFEYAPDYLSLVISDDLGVLEKMWWDVEGNLISTQMPESNPEHFYYDPLGRLISVKQPNGATINFRLNEEGDLISYINEVGGETVFGLNAYGEIQYEIDPAGERISWEYDSSGRMTLIRNAVGEDMRFAYDLSDNLISQRFFDGRIERYKYDLRGQLRQILQPDERITLLGFDSGANILSVEHSTNNSSLSFEYDEQSRCVSAIGPDVEIKFAYDAEGNCLIEEQDSVKIEREYDIEGNCTIIKIEGMGARKYYYDKRNRLIVLIDFDGTRFLFDYDARNRCTTTKCEGVAEIKVGYLPENRKEVVEISNKVVSRRILYKYDAAGRIRERLIDSNSTIKYEYDSVSQLRSRSSNGRFESYRFNSTGDLLLNSLGDSLIYEAGSRLKKTGTTIYEQDVLGRIVIKLAEGRKTQYQYNELNQLVKVLHPDESETEYKYDAFGRRIKKITKEQEIRYIWDDDVLLAEWIEGQSAPYTVYIINQLDDRPLSNTRLGQRCIYATDLTGYPAFIISRDKITFDDYDTWGSSSLRGLEATDHPLRFAGQYADEETGLFYNRYRYYDPETGHYLTPDPIGINGSLNNFSYVTDPVNTYDPLGLQATKVVKHTCPKKKDPKQRVVPKTNPDPCNSSRGSSIHNHCLNKLRKKAENNGYDTRADQSMIHGKGNNRPDLHLSKGRKNIYVEFDYSPASRASGHKKDICSAHPGAVVYLVTIPQTTRFSLTKSGHRPKKPGTIKRSKGPSNKDCGIDKIAL